MPSTPIIIRLLISALLVATVESRVEVIAPPEIAGLGFRAYQGHKCLGKGEAQAAGQQFTAAIRRGTDLCTPPSTDEAPVDFLIMHDYSSPPLSEHFPPECALHAFSSIFDHEFFVELGSRMEARGAIGVIADESWRASKSGIGYMFGDPCTDRESGRFHLLATEASDGEGSFLDFLKEVESRVNGTTFRIRFVDEGLENPWHQMFVSVLYHLTFRFFCALLFFVTALTAIRHLTVRVILLRRQLGQRSILSALVGNVPNVILLIEIACCLAMGTVLAIGGRFGAGSLSSSLRIAFVMMLSGPSLGTSILAGLLWYDQKSSTQRLHAHSNFFVRNRYRLFVIAAICGGIECVVVIAIVTFRGHPVLDVLTTAASGIYTLAQTVVGIYFIRETQSFLKFMDTLSGGLSGLRGQHSVFQKLLRMRQWLLCSAIAMIMYVLVMLMVSTPWFYTPLGWWTCWGLLLPVRATISFSQVMMSRPLSGVTRKSNMTLPHSCAVSLSSENASSQGSIVKESQGGSMADSTMENSATQDTTTTTTQATQVV